MITDQRTTLELNTAVSDHDLLSEYQRLGTEEAFHHIVERYSKLVFSACTRVINDAQAAEDASQAVFLIFAQRARTLKPDTVLAAWFHATARNCARHVQRGMARRETHERMAPSMNNPKTDQDIWTEIRPEVDAALDELPAAQREAILLQFFSGLSVADAAR